MFKKILIANRGEIAVRVIRACQEMGITSAAVYSSADRGSLHVRKADEAYAIGPAPAIDSYLNVERIIEVAQRCGAEAIHPGYGFLSENPRLAESCDDAGIKFIGPAAAAMRMMGSKIAAREAARKANVPVIPGSSHGISFSQAVKEAAEAGYPVMLKAVAGGGGKGMRRVESAGELQSAYDAVTSEAARSFGDDRVYLEKLISNPRHIEMQIFGDEHGNLVYLGERECSLQRRHQKVLEEAPSPMVDAEMRRRLGEIALRVAKAARYSNAGTVEFLVDEKKSFYFLEMNTRLQVEHPVTELVTGLDLVHLQIHTAAGARLPFKQEDILIRGHAIECRIYAEDPDNNFYPSPGKITALRAPSGPGIRDDSGIYEGWNVPLDYDPLLSKLIVYGADRSAAIARLRWALAEYSIGGIKANLMMFRRILENPEFIAGRLDTGLLDRMLQRSFSPAPESKPYPEIAAVAAAIARHSRLGAKLRAGSDFNGDACSDNGEQERNRPTSWKAAARVAALLTNPHDP